MSSNTKKKPKRSIVAILRAVTVVFNSLPLKLRFTIVRTILDCVLLVKPKYLRLAQEQVALSFPEKTTEWHRAIAKASQENFVRAIVDFLRGPTLTRAWIDKHVEIQEPGYSEIKTELDRTGKPFILAGGHIGSFDLLTILTAELIGPMNFVIREAKSPSINFWWKQMREQRGNITMPRSGAIKGMLSSLRSNRTVGILFDQNVTADFALFVPWFGRLAATTKAVALVALKTECPLAVVTIHYIGDEKYRLECIRVPVEDIYKSAESAEEKALALTRRVVSVLEAQIKKFPEQWFWMHRRWRTRPPADASHQSNRLVQ